MMSDPVIMPAIFIGHGSPMNIVLQNDYTRSLKEMGKILPKPDAILVISAHWLTRGTYVTASEKSRQIYDFYGFPPELYKIFYKPPGARDIARMIAKLVPGVEEDDAWGLDHASWAVLCHMYPGDRQREYCS